MTETPRSPSRRPHGTLRDLDDGGLGARHFDLGNGGFVHCDATPEEWRTEMKLAGKIKNSDSPVHTFASFVVEAGGA